jgi:proteic killer suppression protein
MILKFRNKGLAELFVSDSTARINKIYHEKLVDLLDIMDAATGPKDLAGVAQFHQLKGDRKGTWSMHVSGNWVVTFRFDGQNITDVDFEDYH